MSLTEELLDRTTDWPEEHRLPLLAAIQRERWERTARPEQIAPEGDWRVWYIQAGRGAGKTRAGAEWLAQIEAENPPGAYAIIAPTFADGRDTCVEEHLLRILGSRVQIKGWNRSIGELFLKSGSRVYVDGADDGALRIQGKNLRAAWCDEIGLWNKWDIAWNESLSFAVRLEPAQIVATGTPKMGHGLVRQLVGDETVFKTRMRTKDNAQNLPAHVIRKLYEENKGTLRGKQELDGEWISALEGDALKRAWWRYYDKQLLRPSLQGRPTIGNAEIKFQFLIISVDTPLKDKEASDNVAIQVWGADRAYRYLLDAENRQMSYDQAKRAIREKSRWARYNWRCQHRILIENAGYGPDLAMAHVNHMLRGQESKQDEGFVREVADHLSLPVHVMRVDVHSLAKRSGKSIQHAARDARYGYFAELTRHTAVGASPLPIIRTIR